LSKPANEQWICFDLPILEYNEALTLQRELVAARADEDIDQDMVLLLEHPAVFTLGRRGGIENLRVSNGFLKKLNIPIIQIERGGNITFHGPGQLVVYPIVDLKKAKLNVLDHVKRLEEVMIRVAADWGIKARRNSANRGIWINNNKLGSVGISVHRDICFHGFSLNANVSLKPFEWIHPCGLFNVGVTSMEQELSKKVSMDGVRDAVKRHVETVFGVKMLQMEQQWLMTKNRQ
jgi:lipoate-protein ligase B